MISFSSIFVFPRGPPTLAKFKRVVFAPWDGEHVDRRGEAQEQADVGRIV